MNNRRPLAELQVSDETSVRQIKVSFFTLSAFRICLHYYIIEHADGTLIDLIKIMRPFYFAKWNRAIGELGIYGCKWRKRHWWRSHNVNVPSQSQWATTSLELKCQHIISLKNIQKINCQRWADRCSTSVSDDNTMNKLGKKFRFLYIRMD